MVSFGGCKRMLMAAIISWGRDLLFMPVESVQYVRALKMRLGPGKDYIIFDTVFLWPFRFDHAYRELMEDEVIEFIHSQAYPELIKEGRIKLKNGKYPRIIRAGDTFEAKTG